ncbi:MAG: hypothetical protein K2H29_12825 [Oscillospiraceae bacterium]|nr:hypothetical protein [Oscillospiraceae bacterium]
MKHKNRFITFDKFSVTTIEPIYSNEEKVCFLASDVLTALQELNMNYTDLDRICLSSYGGIIPLTNAKILIIVILF